MTEELLEEVKRGLCGAAPQTKGGGGRGGGGRGGAKAKKPVVEDEDEDDERLLGTKAFVAVPLEEGVKRQRKQSVAYVDAWGAKRQTW